MTVVPARLRVITGTPHNVEHALVFFAAAIAFGLGYELPTNVFCVAAVVFCAVVEFVQLAAPGCQRSSPRPLRWRCGGGLRGGTGLSPTGGDPPYTRAAITHIRFPQWLRQIR